MSRHSIGYSITSSAVAISEMAKPSALMVLRLIGARSSRHCSGGRQTVYLLGLFSKRWMMGAAPSTNFVPVICSYILIYRFDISSEALPDRTNTQPFIHHSEGLPYYGALLLRQNNKLIDESALNESEWRLAPASAVRSKSVVRKATRSRSWCFAFVVASEHQSRRRRGNVLNSSDVC